MFEAILAFGLPFYHPACLFFIFALLFKLGTTCRNAACDGIVDASRRRHAARAGMEHRTGSPADQRQRRQRAGRSSARTCFQQPSLRQSSSSGTATASSITSDTSADNSGTAGYFRVYTGAGGDTAALCSRATAARPAPTSCSITRPSWRGA
jgi:hypothetical protein